MKMLGERSPSDLHVAVVEAVHDLLAANSNYADAEAAMRLRALADLASSLGTDALLELVARTAREDMRLV